MIEVRNLTKYYGPLPAIENISFTVEKGEIVGFLGPNGAGKSTTMKILTCFMPATSGTATVSGYDIFFAPMEVKKRIGYLPEQPPLYDDMTVTGYLTYVAEIKGIKGKEIDRSLEKVLDTCSISNVKHRIIGRLSKGYKQRVGLAQALIHNPEILILDEPTVGLDPKQIIEIRRLIKELAKSHTILLSSHILPEITMTCQRVVIINEGKIAAVDSLDKLSANLRKSEKISIEVKRPDTEITTRLGEIQGVIHVQQDNDNKHRFIVESEIGSDFREEIARTIVQNNFGLLEIKPLSLSLEDVFLKLTTEEEGRSIAQ